MDTCYSFSRHIKGRIEEGMCDMQGCLRLRGCDGWGVMWQGLEACVSLRRADKARQLWGLATAHERGVEGVLEAYVAALLSGGEGREALEVVHRARGQGTQVQWAHARLLQGEEEGRGGSGFLGGWRGRWLSLVVVCVRWQSWRWGRRRMKG